MADEKKERVNKVRRARGGKASGCGVYGLGIIGALVYYIGHATTFGVGVVGVFKAIFWPAFLVYHVIPLIKM
jgi:hypothetical protein